MKRKTLTAGQRCSKEHYYNSDVLYHFTQRAVIKTVNDRKRIIQQLLFLIITEDLCLGPNETPQSASKLCISAPTVSEPCHNWNCVAVTQC
jgi:hypothetical protein